MAGPNQTRHLGSACRIYKNSANKVIAMDSIEAVADTRRIPSKATRSASETTFHYSAYMEYKRSLFYLGEGDRVVAKILMCGDFSSLTEDGGNYLSLTWQTPSDANDATISLNELARVGDTV